MRNDWFRTINMPGVDLTDMEIFNCVCSGEHVEALKERFSNATPFLSKVAMKYLKGNPIRQEIEEQAIKMVCPDVESYLAEHRHDPDVSMVEAKFEAIFDWAESTFPTYYREMRGLYWGRMYDAHHETFFSRDEIGNAVANLMADEHVTAKRGGVKFALQMLSGIEPDKSLLTIRMFDDATYTRQTVDAKANGTSNCPLCAISDGPNKNKIHKFKEMWAEHASPGRKGVGRHRQMRHAGCTPQQNERKPLTSHFHTKTEV